MGLKSKQDAAGMQFLPLKLWMKVQPSKYSQNHSTELVYLTRFLSLSSSLPPTLPFLTPSLNIRKENMPSLKPPKLEILMLLRDTLVVILMLTQKMR